MSNINATEISKKNTILDLLKFDPTKFYKEEYREVETQDTPAIQIVDYEKRLNDLEFDIFDTLRFRVLFDKNNITGDTHVNATYRCKKRMTTWEDTMTLINYLHKKYGKDDNGYTQWCETDKKDVENGTFMRIWPTLTGDSFLSIYFKEIGGLEMNILFLNNMLRNLDKKIEF